MDLNTPAEIECPHCGEVFSVQIDTSQAEQSLIEDCAVCCRPIQVEVQCQPGEVIELRTSPL